MPPGSVLAIVVVYNANSVTTDVVVNYNCKN